MTRRELLAAAPAALMAQVSRPNVLIILLDDLGCADLGYLGASDLQTPNIDALAAGGVKFRNWYSNAPVCAPARASILSGRFPARAGVADNGGTLTPGMSTIASTLKGASYSTGCFGKWHLGSDERTCPNAHGFDSFYGFHSGCVDYFSHRFYWGDPRIPNYHDLWRNRTEVFEDGQYLTGRITEEAVDFIGRQKQPFFGYVAYNAPHYPMHAPAKYLKRFAGLGKERQTYAAMIAAVDDGVGAIRQSLERAGALENTLLFLLGDNGATVEKRAGLNGEFATAGSNGAFKGFKFSLFDGGMHVPALMSWPSQIRRGAWTSELVMSMDMFPTICRATGVKLPDGVDGLSLLDVAAGGASPHGALCWAQGGQQAVRLGVWKLVVNGQLHDRSVNGGKPLTGEDAVWLSKLDEDPGETRNLRRTQPAVVDQLLTELSKWTALR